MAKYLQDIYIYFPTVPNSFSKLEEEKFNLDNRELWNSLKLIEDLYNFNFPKKYITHDGLWRLFINITTDSVLDLSKEGRENYCYIDIDYMKQIDSTNRKKYLFDKVSKQIIIFCKSSKYSFKEFEVLNSLILEKDIRFNEPYRKEKTSPDRKHKAAIWAKFDEFEKATYIKVVDKEDKDVLFTKIDDQHFCNFKNISWRDNETVRVFEINSYSVPRQFEDYYEIDLKGNCNYRPVTREANFHYGLKLLKDDTTFKRGLDYIKIAAKLNHGKANNILENLIKRPQERNVNNLIQQNKKKQSLS